MRALGSLAAVAALTVGCFSERPASAPAPPRPPVFVPAEPAVARAPMPRESDADLRAAVIRVYSTWCGTMSEGERAAFAAACERVKRAGPGVLPVIARLIARGEVSDWFVCGAVEKAATYPLYPPLRQALREWRARPDPRAGDEPGAAPPARCAPNEVLEYFARFGDETDLAWLERAAEKRTGNEQLVAREQARRLRGRLGVKERDEPTPPVCRFPPGNR